MKHKKHVLMKQTEQVNQYVFGIQKIQVEMFALEKHHMIKIVKYIKQKKNVLMKKTGRI